MSQQWMSIETLFQSINRSLQQSNNILVGQAQDGTPFTVKEFAVELAVYTSLREDAAGESKLLIQFPDDVASVHARTDSDHKLSRVQLKLQPTLLIEQGSSTTPSRI